MDLLLNRDSSVHDLVFINGECPTTGDYTDVVIQRLYLRLRTFSEEWFLNYEYGVPYFSVLGQKVPKSSVDIMIQDHILKEKGVAQIVEFSSSLNSDTRKYACKFRVRCDTGEITETIDFQE